MTQQQRQRERPPTASEARQWYADGWIDEDALDQLLETAMETYGGDGDQEFAEVAGGIETTKEKADKIEVLQDRADESYYTRLRDVDVKYLLNELLKGALWMLLGFILYDIALFATQPPAGAIPAI